MKEWLQKNKIYFETIAATLLSIMAIIVTISSNRISELSKEISYRNALPNFEIITIYDRWNSNKITQLEKKVVYHTSGKYKNLNTKLISFYDIVFQDSAGRTYNIQFPFKDNIYIHYPGEREEKVVKEILGIYSPAKFDTLINMLEKAFTTINCNMGMSHMVSFLKLEYIDLIDNKIIDYYDVTFNESKWLSKYKGNDLFKDYNDLYSKNIFIDFDDFNETKLRYLIEKIRKDPQKIRPRHNIGQI